MGRWKRIEEEEQGEEREKKRELVSYFCILLSSHPPSSHETSYSLDSTSMSITLYSKQTRDGPI
jgi:hypothetical protein